MAIRLIAIDIDDTLIDRTGRVDPRTVQAIADARQRGIAVTLATGRMFYAARPYAELLELDLPLICCQGGLLQDRHGNPPLWCMTVPVEPAQAALRLLREHKALFHGYFDNEIHAETISTVVGEYAARIGAEYRQTDDLGALLAERPAMEVMAILKPERIDAVEAALRQQAGDELHICRFRDIILEILHPQARKELALQALARQVGAEQHEVLAIGDNYNDLAMIEWAGVGVAVANAEAAVRAAADWVCPSNLEAGVASALKRFVL